MFYTLMIYATDATYLEREEGLSKLEPYLIQSQNGVGTTNSLLDSLVMFNSKELSETLPQMIRLLEGCSIKKIPVTRGFMKEMLRTIRFIPMGKKSTVVTEILMSYWRNEYDILCSLRNYRNYVR